MVTVPQDSLLGAVHPYYRSILDAYAAAQRPYFHQLSPADARAQLRAGFSAAPSQEGLPELAAVTDEAIAGANRAIPVRRYRPFGEVEGLCLFLHAGGWVIGDVNLSDSLCRRLAAGAACEVVSVEYRLAPEHPHPAALDDAFAVLSWTATLDRGRLVVAGESAGANLAAACAIRAREAGGPRLAGQFLAYPVTDHDFTTGSYQEVGDRNWLLSTADMKWFWDQYCPLGADRNDPLLSPLRLADASGLPPALVCVAEFDPLREEGLAYAKMLAQAGVRVRTRRDAGMLHGYLSAAGSVPIAADAVGETATWIKERIRDTGN